MKDHEGRDLHFGPTILDHWKDKLPGERQRRLERLNDAIKTAQEPREVWENSTNAGTQRTYLRVTKDDKDKRRYHVGFETDQNGVVTNFFHTPRAMSANNMRRGTLAHGRD